MPSTLVAIDVPALYQMMSASPWLIHPDHMSKLVIGPPYAPGAAGDHVLEITARKLRAALRDADRVGRVGGDGFLVVCTAVESGASALGIAERPARTLTTDLTVGTDTIELRASVGPAWTDRPIHADASGRRG
jgi:predicted signal transduction protein with EAL and GGDEF domain